MLSDVTPPPGGFALLESKAARGTQEDKAFHMKTANCGVGGLPVSPPLTLLRADVDSGLSCQELQLPAAGDLEGEARGWQARW